MAEIEDVIKEASQTVEETRKVIEKYFSEKEDGKDPNSDNVFRSIYSDEISLYNNERKKIAISKLGENINDVKFVENQLEVVKNLEPDKKYCLLYDLWLAVDSKVIGISLYNYIVNSLSGVFSDLSEIAYEEGNREAGNILRAKGFAIGQCLLLG